MSQGTDPSAQVPSLRWPVGAATGVGSLPGTNAPVAARVVADALADLPHQPELPDRGPAAAMLGRGVGLLVDIAAQWEVRGWQLVARPGADVRRALAFLEQDGDATEEAFGSFTGCFKVQVVGPVTLAAEVETARGHRAATDQGARRDLAASLTEGVAQWLATLARRLPKAQLVLQLDEPSLPAALAGSLPTASGWGRIAPIPSSEVVAALADVVRRADEVAVATIVHCCAPDPPVALVRRSGAAGVSIDLGVSGDRADHALASWLEADGRLFAGVDVAAGQSADDSLASRLDPLMQLWGRTGLVRRRLDQVIVTPPCGLGGSAHPDVPAAYRSVVDAGRWLRDEAEG